MTRNEILNFYKKEGRIRFGELINDKANFKRDFDSKAFKHFLRLSNISSNIKREILLQNFDCLTPDRQLTNLGVLFFSKDIDFIMNYALVDCVLFKGTEKVKILDRKQYTGNRLIRQAGLNGGQPQKWIRENRNQTRSSVLLKPRLPRAFLHEQIKKKVAPSLKN